LLHLKKLSPLKDVSLNYLNWMNDKEITNFTNQKNKIHTLESIKKFIEEKNNSTDEYLYGIFTKNDEHIGNIKIGPTDINNYTHISYLIGDKNYWGKGYATHAIKNVLMIAKEKKLLNIIAYTAKLNIASIKALLKNGFEIIKKEKKFIKINNSIEDTIVLLKYL